MKVTISKTFDFDAAHFLPKVPDGHKCKRMHGHTYRVEIACSGPIDDRGMVMDYAEIATAWVPLNDMLDHRVLNEIPGLDNPTTEILAPFVFRILDANRCFWLADKTVGLVPLLRAVRVYESSTTWCEVRR